KARPARPASLPSTPADPAESGAKPLRGRCASPDTTATARGMAAARRTGQVQATAPASSKSSSNAAEPPRTAPHQPRLITAGQPTGGTDSDGLNRARAPLLIRGARGRGRSGAPLPHPALGLSHLLAEAPRVLAAYYDRRTGARPPSVNQTAHALPDVPVRELGRVRPPVRDILEGGSPGLSRSLFLHNALPASLEALD